MVDKADGEIKDTDKLTPLKQNNTDNKDHTEIKLKYEDENISQNMQEPLIRFDELNADLQPIFAFLSIDYSEIEVGRSVFENKEIHLEWMNRINTTLVNHIDLTKGNIFKQNHLTMLLIKDYLDDRYSNELINYEDYKHHLKALIKWHHKTYQEILNDEEYERLFEEKKYSNIDGVIDSIIDMGSELEIMNPSTSFADVKNQVPTHKLDVLIKLQKEKETRIRETLRMYEYNSITKKETLNSLKEINQHYLENARDILDDEEYLLIFDSN